MAGKELGKRRNVSYWPNRDRRVSRCPMLFISMMTKISPLLMMPQNCSNVLPLWNDMVNIGKETTLKFTTYWQYGQWEVMLKHMLTPSNNNMMAEVHGGAYIYIPSTAPMENPFLGAGTPKPIYICPSRCTDVFPTYQSVTQQKTNLTPAYTLL